MSLIAAKTKFRFSEENSAKVKAVIDKYPPGRQASAVLPLLDLAQRQNGSYLTQEAIECVAEILNMPVIRVYEVATFYSMFNLKPVGKHFLQICTTTPCMLRGSESLVKLCRKKLGIEAGETTEDGEFTMIEVECLGGCVNAPIVQINDDYYEDLDEDSFARILNDLRAGKKPEPGSVDKSRHKSAPSGYINPSEKGDN